MLEWNLFTLKKRTMKVEEKEDEDEDKTENSWLQHTDRGMTLTLTGEGSSLSDGCSKRGQVPEKWPPWSWRFGELACAREWARSRKKWMKVFCVAADVHTQWRFQCSQAADNSSLPFVQSTSLNFGFCNSTSKRTWQLHEQETTDDWLIIDDWLLQCSWGLVNTVPGEPGM